MFTQRLVRHVMTSSVAAAGRQSALAMGGGSAMARPSAVCCQGLIDAANAGGFDQTPQQTQTRSMVTKKRIHRQEKRKRWAELAEKGIFPRKPQMYLDKDTPVKNAVPREDRDAESKRQDEVAAAELNAKLEIVKEPNLMRFGFEATGLVMSDRVRKLLDLHNGNQKDVVKSQKKRGMEMFEMREGDTGSSAVQVIALTTRIQQVQTHLRMHKKDKHSKRGLDAMYVRRRKLLDYMERKEFETYRKVVKTLGLTR